MMNTLNLQKRNREWNGKLTITGGVILIFILITGMIWYKSQDTQEKLMIGAAASMKSAMEEILEEYRAQNPKLDIQATYGSSGTLEQQIRQGAPIDIFLSASPGNMDALSNDQLIIDSTRVDLLRNQLVLIESSKSKLKLQGFEDLPKATQIAIGDPKSVPAGKYAQEVLEYLGLWDEVEVLAVYGKDVTEVLTWVASGNVDAGMVYSTEASLSDQVRVVAMAPEGSHNNIIYPAALVKGTKSDKLGKEFIEYLTSEEARKVFLKYGFLTID